MTNKPLEDSSDEWVLVDKQPLFQELNKSSVLLTSCPLNASAIGTASHMKNARQQNRILEIARMGIAAGTAFVIPYEFMISTTASMLGNQFDLKHRISATMTLLILNPQATTASILVEGLVYDGSMRKIPNDIVLQLQHTLQEYIDDFLQKIKKQVSGAPSNIASLAQERLTTGIKQKTTEFINSHISLESPLYLPPHHNTKNIGIGIDASGNNSKSIYTIDSLDYTKAPNSMANIDTLKKPLNSVTHLFMDGLGIRNKIETMGKK